MQKDKKPIQTSKPVKKYSEMTPQEKEALGNAFREKLRKYYANRPSRQAILGSMEEDQDEQS